MRRGIRRWLTAICMLGLVLIALEASASVQRIRFKRGATSANVTGYLSGSRQICYVLNARSGQHMKLQAEGKGATVGEVTMPSGNKDGQPGGVFFDNDLTESGDYRVCISASNMGERWKGAFTLTVEIR